MNLASLNVSLPRSRRRRQAGFPGHGRGGGRRGFAASVIVLALLFVMSALLLATGRVVHSLRQELRQVEQRQLQKFAPSARTNTVAAVRR